MQNKRKPLSIALKEARKKHPYIMPTTMKQSVRFVAIPSDSLPAIKSAIAFQFQTARGHEITITESFFNNNQELEVIRDLIHKFSK